MSSDGEDQEIRSQFFNFLGAGDSLRKLIRDLLIVTTDIVDAEDNVAGLIETNIIMGPDNHFKVIDPMLFIETEYWQTIIPVHLESVRIKTERYLDAINFTKTIGRALTSFLLTLV